jgi:hypothetical protein
VLPAQGIYSLHLGVFLRFVGVWGEGEGAAQAACATSMRKQTGAPTHAQRACATSMRNEHAQRACASAHAACEAVIVPGRRRYIKGPVDAWCAGISSMLAAALRWIGLINSMGTLVGADPGLDGSFGTLLGADPGL